MTNSNPKIQVAVLLDVSNSMDSLLQRQGEILKIFSVKGKEKKKRKDPKKKKGFYRNGGAPEQRKDG